MLESCLARRAGVAACIAAAVAVASPASASTIVSGTVTLGGTNELYVPPPGLVPGNFSFFFNRIGLWGPPLSPVPETVWLEGGFVLNSVRLSGLLGQTGVNIALDGLSLRVDNGFFVSKEVPVAFGEPTIVDSLGFRLLSGSEQIGSFTLTYELHGLTPVVELSNVRIDLIEADDPRVGLGVDFLAQSLEVAATVSVSETIVPTPATVLPLLGAWGVCLRRRRCPS